MQRGIRLTWSRFVLIAYSILFIYVAWGVFQDSILASPSIEKNIGKKIILGLSLVEAELSNAGATDNILTTSFRMQSQNPIAQIYLDYISIYPDNNIPSKVCFKSISLVKNKTVLLEAVLGIIPTNPLG